MSKDWTVFVVRDVAEMATFSVEADSKEEATTKAMKMLKDEPSLNLQWEHDDCGLTFLDDVILDDDLLSDPAPVRSREER